MNRMSTGGLRTQQERVHDGGCKVSDSVAGCSLPLGPGPQVRDRFVSSAPPRCIECNS